MSKFEGQYKARVSIGTAPRKGERGEPRTIAAGELVEGLSDDDMQSLFDRGRIYEVRAETVLQEVAKVDTTQQPATGSQVTAETTQTPATGT